jgi:autotransporter translocation and assembly factor TamB
MKFLPARLLVVALAAFAIASSHAASLSKFKGTYDGTFTANGSFVGYSGNTAGDAKVKIKPTQKNQAATITISGTDPETGRDYDATIKLNKDGTATTDAIVPGIDYEANGSWKLSSNGKKITVKLSATSTLGNATGTATLQVNGDVLKVKSSGDISSILGSGSGRFDFTGKK